MHKTPCPHCEKDAITISDRLKALHWFSIHCANCGKRSCMNPILLSIFWFVVVWDIFFFGFMAWAESSVIYFTIMIVGWIIIDVFGYYIPLSRMRSLPVPDSNNG